MCLTRLQGSDATPPRYPDRRTRASKPGNLSYSSLEGWGRLHLERRVGPAASSSPPGMYRIRWPGLDSGTDRSASRAICLPQNAEGMALGLALKRFSSIPLAPLGPWGL